MLRRNSVGAVTRFVAVTVCLCHVPSVAAQTIAPSTRRVNVEGVQMRVWTAGIEKRKPGQPVVVLEAGSGADLETWKLYSPSLQGSRWLWSSRAYWARCSGRIEPARRGSRASGGRRTFRF